MYYPIANKTFQPISYSQIRCIALRVLQTSNEFGFSGSVNHSSGPLREHMFTSY